MKMIYSTGLILLLSLGLFFSCGEKEEQTILMTVASEKRIGYNGVGIQPCFLVKLDSGGDWSFFYDNIRGFEYEEGFEYVLMVYQKKIDRPAQDQSSLQYSLVDIVSKQAKHSENMPDDAYPHDPLPE